MRRAAWSLLLLFVFAIPWEYSLDLGAPWGNAARIVGLVLLLVIVPAILQAGKIRRPALLQWIVLALFLWLCISAFWSIDPRATALRLPGYVQEMMIVWLVWELAENETDLRQLLQAYMAGACVLAVLTVANFAALALPEQARFAPQGQDPNDVARYLVLALPIAAWLAEEAPDWVNRSLAIGYIAAGSFAILLTASRGGFLAAALSLIGCAVLLFRRHARMGMGALLVALSFVCALWLIVPRETFLRLGSIPEQLLSGDLNQRWNIWAAGWHAFVRAPIAGWGAGSFVLAAGLAPMDTAHNTALAIATEGGLIGMVFAVAILVVSLLALRKLEGSVRIALGTAFVAWLFLSLVSNVQDSRTTWLLLALIAVAGPLQERELFAAAVRQELTRRTWNAEA